MKINILITFLVFSFTVACKRKQPEILIDALIKKEKFVVSKLNSKEIEITWGEKIKSYKFHDKIYNVSSDTTKPLLIYNKKITPNTTNIYIIDDHNLYFAIKLEDSRIAFFGLNRTKEQLAIFENIENVAEPIIFGVPFLAINKANNDIVAGSTLGYEEYPNGGLSKFTNVSIYTTFGNPRFFTLMVFRIYLDKAEENLKENDDGVVYYPRVYYNNIFSKTQIPNPLNIQKNWTGE